MKRTTETVLRDEVAKAERKLATAKRRLELDDEAVASAVLLRDEQKAEVAAATDTLGRSRRALEAFLGLEGVTAGNSEASSGGAT